MDTTELLARAWIECDPNRGGSPDTPESEASFRKLKAAARELRNHYARIGEQKFGRI